MPADRSLTRLLLRGSLLLIGTLAIWWLALQTPLLAVLRVSAEAAAPSFLITTDPAGAWIFRIPVSDAAVHFIEFSMPRADVVLFTFSLPVYCAIALAIPLRRSAIRGLLWGAAAVTLIEVLSLLAVLEITAHSALAQFHPAAGGDGAWTRQFADYLLIQVIPFAAPILIGVASHRELRSRLFAQGV